MGKYSKFLIYWLPPILWAGGIFYLSGISGLSSNMTVFWDVFWRKIFHAVEFGILNLLVWRALYYEENMSLKRSLGWSFFLTAFYAVSDELHQYFIANRQCRWQDMAQDSLGAMAAATAIFLSYRSKILKEK